MHLLGVWLFLLLGLLVQERVPVPIIVDRLLPVSLGDPVVGIALSIECVIGIVIDSVIRVIDILDLLRTLLGVLVPIYFLPIILNIDDDNDKPYKPTYKEQHSG